MKTRTGQVVSLNLLQTIRLRLKSSKLNKNPRVVNLETLATFLKNLQKLL